MAEIYPVNGLRDDLRELQIIREQADQFIKDLRDMKSAMNTATAENALEEMAQATDDWLSDTIGAAITVLREERDNRPERDRLGRIKVA